MNIGATIKKLRRERDMTQEQLAEYLGISPQAVSRWETNLAMPDIALLPALANIFDVSVDYMLGVDIANKEKQILEIAAEASKYSTGGYHLKAAEILREGLRNYPNSHKLMNDLMNALFSSPQELFSSAKAAEEPGKDQINNLYTEVITLGEKILAESTDNNLRNSALSTLCLAYTHVDRREDAVRLAETLPTAWLSRDAMLALIYEGDKRYNQFQRNIVTELDQIELWLSGINAMLDNRKAPYTREEDISIKKKITEIIKIIIEDGNYGFFEPRLAWTYLEIAWNYAELGDRKNTIEYLVLAKNHAVTTDTTFSPKKKYTCLLLRDIEFGGVHHNTTSNDSLHQLETMERKAFDFVRDDAAFIGIQAELRKSAEKH